MARVRVLSLSVSHGIELPQDCKRRLSGSGDLLPVCTLIAQLDWTGYVKHFTMRALINIPRDHGNNLSE